MHKTRAQIEKVILYLKPVLNVRFKDFWYTKLILVKNIFYLL